LGDLTGGVRILLIGFLVLTIVVLVLLFIWTWENGYYFIFDKILQKNKKVELEGTYSDQQKMVGYVIYGIYFAAIVLCFFGIIWAIMDAITPTGKWGIFLTYPFGTQVTVLGTFATLFFLLLIGSMMILKQGLKIIYKAVFDKKKVEISDAML
jgi:hypothetical protein